MALSLTSYIDSLVAKQYEEWSYPAPISDLESYVKQGGGEPDNLRIILPLVWPEGKSLKNMKILIAGCGTNQAAYHAFTLPNCLVTGIDISKKSIQNQESLKIKHKLGNLELHQLSLLEVENLGVQYDYIISSGVLHHLDNPISGLRALRNVLAPDGAISIMLYAPYVRQGVYMLQEVFRDLSLPQTADSVALIRKALDHLPGHHIANLYKSIAKELIEDVAIVDTFLHPRDIAFSVKDIIRLLENSDLSFWSWIDSSPYSPDAALGSHHPLLQSIKKLRPENQWSCVELLTQSRGYHHFIATHPIKKLHHAITFDGNDWINYIPIIRYGLQVSEKGDLKNNTPAILRRNNNQINLTILGTLIISLVDNKRTIKDIMLTIKQSLPNIKDEEFCKFFVSMNEMGHLLFSKVPIT